MTLGHDQRDIVRHAVLAPHLQDVLHQARLAVETLPGDVAGLERIMFEGDEGQVGEPTVCLEVVDKADHPRRAALRIGPHPDVFVDTLENRPSQPELRVDLVQGSSPLQVERRIVFRHGVLAVGLFSHLDVPDRVAAPLDVGDLCRGVVGCTVEHRDRNHGRQVVRQPAGEEKVEPGVLVGSAVVHVGC